MPSSKELVANRPLAGHELAKVMLKDFSDMLTGDSMLTRHVAYGRVSYEIRITMHMDNPAFPTSTSQVKSQPRSEQEIHAMPELEAIKDGPPLPDPSPEAYVRTLERLRAITSPNVTRIENEMPVTVLTQGGNGNTTEERQVVYPPESVEDQAVAPIDIDLTRQTKEAWTKK